MRPEFEWLESAFRIFVSGFWTPFEKSETFEDQTRSGHSNTVGLNYQTRSDFGWFNGIRFANGCSKFAFGWMNGDRFSNVL